MYFLKKEKKKKTFARILTGMLIVNIVMDGTVFNAEPFYSYATEIENAQIVSEQDNDIFQENVLEQEEMVGGDLEESHLDKNTASDVVDDVCEEILEAKDNNGESPDNEILDVTSAFISSVYETGESEGWSYEIDETGVTISGYNGPQMTSLVIPDTIEDKVVYSIKENAFSNNIYLERISIPNSVVQIGYHAFLNCTNLIDVTLPNNAELQMPIYGLSNRGKLFEGCTKLSQVEIPETWTYVPNNLFEKSNLTQIDISESNVETIGNNAFSGITTLERVVLPSTLKEIGHEAFSNDTALAEIVIPDNVTKIGYRVFYNCNNLTEVKLPNNNSLQMPQYNIVASTCGTIFEGCTKLQQVDIPEAWTYIPNGFFARSCLTEIDLKNSKVETIKADAFSEMKDLEKIMFPDSLSAIGIHAFYKINIKQDITLPETLKTVGDRAFEDAVLRGIDFSLGQLTNIGNDCFNGCKADWLIYHFADEFFFSACNNDIVTKHSEDYKINSYISFQSYFTLKSNGEEKVKYTLHYELNDTSITPKNILIMFKTDPGLQLATVTLDGVVVQNLIYQNSTLTIPIAENKGTVQFELNSYQKNENAVTSILTFQNNYWEAIQEKNEEDIIQLLTVHCPGHTSTKTIKLFGKSPTKELIRIYVNNNYECDTLPDENGNYAVYVVLNPTSEREKISFKVIQGEEEASTYTIYNCNEAELEEWLCYYNYHGKTTGYDLINNSEQRKYIAFMPGSQLVFKMKFSNSVSNVKLVSEKNGEKKYLDAYYNEELDSYIASGYFDKGNPYYVPENIRVEYDVCNDYSSIYEDFCKKIEEIWECTDVKLFREQNGNVNRITANICERDTGEELYFYELFIENNNMSESIEENTCIENDIMAPVKTSAENIEDGISFICDVGDTTIRSHLESMVYMEDIKPVPVIVAEVFLDSVRNAQIDEIAENFLETDLNETKEEFEKLCNEIDPDLPILYNVVLKITGVEEVSNILGGALVTVQRKTNDFFTTCINELNASDSSNLPSDSVDAGNEMDSFTKRSIWSKVNFLIDPSGVVYEGSTSNYLEGVTATIYYKTEDGDVIQWNAEAYDQMNPLLTNSSGMYAWDVPEGLWQVKFEKPGYETHYSEWMEVPPPRFNVDAGMISTVSPYIESLHLYDGYIELVFSQYMLVDSLNSFVITDLQGKNIEYSVSCSSEEHDENGNKVTMNCKLMMAMESEELSTVKFNAPSDVLNYAGKRIAGFNSILVAEKRPQINVVDLVNVQMSEKITIPFSIDNYEGQKIYAKSEFEEMLQIDEYEINSDGNGKIYLSANMFGNTNVILGLQNSSIKNSIAVLIGKEEQNDTFKVSFNPTGGELVDQDTFILKNEGLYPELPTPIKRGYQFEGWYTTKQGGIKITKDIPVLLNSDTMLYARWVEDNQYVNNELFSYSSIAEQVYTGNNIKPEPEIIYDGIVLQKGKDYTLSYKNNKNVPKESSNKIPTVVVNGKGNFSQKIEIPFQIIEKNIEDTDISISIADKTFTGKCVKSKPVIKYKNQILKENRDYMLIYSGECIEAGNVMVEVLGIGNYFGKRNISYKIYEKLKDFSKLYVEPIEKQEYSGEEICPNIVLKNSKSDSNALSNEDYIIVYQNNVDVGKATVVISGKNQLESFGNFKKITFEIVKKDINDAEISIEEEVSYSAKALKPAITVIDCNSGKVIPADCYTVSYSNNMNATSEMTDNKKYPTIKVTGKKNYRGIKTRTFEIHPIELTNIDGTVVKELQITVPQIQDSKYGISEKNINPIIKYNNKKLVKGTDYVVSFSRDENSKMQKANIQFQGNYIGETNVPFMIYEKNISENEVNICMLQDSFEYTGQKIFPKVLATSVVDGNVVKLEEGNDYTITYSNNINVGDAGSFKGPKVKVVGVGAYKGINKILTFNIIPKVLDTKDFIISVEDVKYTGREIKPKVNIIDRNTGKAFPQANYTVVYKNNIDISDDKPEVIIKAKGNYTGEINSIYFRIYKKSISSLYSEKIPSVTYTGKAVTPSADSINIYLDKSKKIKLQEGIDYTLSYEKNIKVGTAKVVVTGIGDFGGKKNTSFMIVPKWLEWIVNSKDQ